MNDSFFLFAIATYTVRSLFFVIGSSRERGLMRPPINTALYEALPKVSVIVPARNEERHIVQCVESLAALDYPVEKLEIIVVDDRSTDSTPTILKMQQARFENLRVVRIESDGEKNLIGKAGALDRGFSIATGEIVMMTDADCIVHPEWVRSHVGQYDSENVGCVCAYTLVDGSNLFARLQSVEWNTTHTMASAAVYFKQYLGCYGNNMSVRRRAYDRLGGYANIPFSVTEDLALLQAMTRNGFTAHYLCSQQSSVTTHALETLKEYIAQHKRWTLGGRQLGFRAVIFVLTSVILWAAIIGAVVTQQWEWLAAVILTRVIDDMIINAPVLNLLHRNSLQIYTIPAVLFFTVLELLLPFLILDRTTVWKGQAFKS